MENDGPKMYCSFRVVPSLSDKEAILNVKKILKGSLDSIPSPSLSVKIQIMDGKVYLRCKGKILLGIVNKLLKTKSLFTEGKGDVIQSSLSS